MFKLDIGLASTASTSIEHEELETLRRGNPAARMLPLLQAIACGKGECDLPYNEQQRLHVEIEACR